MAKNIDMAALTARIEQESAFIPHLKQSMHTHLIGQHALVDFLLVALLADGHVLLEGLPGLAKTLAIKTLSTAVDGQFSRIQFTPDLLPADVIGTLIYSQKEEQFRIKKGPVFAHFVLADEINRAPAKVQSALLEAMQERQVTIGDETHALPTPFMVLATQNPIDQEGTYRLPEAQTDRFMLKVIVDYPTIDEEKQIVKAQLSDRLQDACKPVVDTKKLLQVRQIVKDVYVDERISDYIVNLVFATRTPSAYGMDAAANYIDYGASPRASIALALAARARAFSEHRAYVVPEDVRFVAPAVLRHRIGLSYEAEAEAVSVEQLIHDLLNHVQVP